MQMSYYFSICETIKTVSVKALVQFLRDRVLFMSVDWRGFLTIVRKVDQIKRLGINIGRRIFKKAEKRRLVCITLLTAVCMAWYYTYRY